MTGTTPTYSLPYQEPGDPPHGPDLGRDLAEQIEFELSRIDSSLVSQVAALTNTIISNSSTPVCGVYTTGSQSITSGVNTAVTFPAEFVDTHGFHSNISNNSRITPTIPGYYIFYGVAMYSNNASTIMRECNLLKNGNNSVSPTRGAWAPGSNVAHTAGPMICVDMANGSTDTFQLGVRHFGGTYSLQGGDAVYVSSFFCAFLRPL